MSVVVLSNFDGIVPRVGPTYLQDNMAQEARNVKLQSGELRPWRKPEPVYKVEQKGVQTIMKLEGAGGVSMWLEWTKDTDVCYSPIADNEDYRIYYSEDGVCKKTNWRLCSEGKGPAPRNWLYMGVPAPKKKLQAKANRVKNDEEKWKKDRPDTPYEPYSSDNTENRVYVYTYVSEFGNLTEESAPSPVVEVVCDTVGGSVELTGFEDPPTDHYNITRVRVYRAVGGSSGSVFMLVDELRLKKHVLQDEGASLNGVRWSERKYVDTITSKKLGKELDTALYTPPPEGLRGLVTMPNGFLAGFINNQVWFSEPYSPHAWPSTYMLTTDSPIVGLGVYGNTLVVATTRQPYTITGSHPASMTQEKQPMFQPCVSKRSIAYDQYGVIYASAYGLVALAAGQMDVFTRDIVTQDDWQEFNPSTMRAVMYNNLYITSYRKANENRLLVFARGDSPALTQYDFTPSAMHVERRSGRLYCLREEDNTIYLMDASRINREQYEWKSKRFFFPYWTSFSAMKMDAYFNTNEDVKAFEAVRAEVVKKNEVVWEERRGKSVLGELNAHTLNTFQVNGGLLASVPTGAEIRWVGVSLYGDDKLVYYKVFRDNIACRIPPVRANTWEIRLSGTVNVRSFAMATTMVELASPK